MLLLNNCNIPLNVFFITKTKKFMHFVKCLFLKFTYFINIYFQVTISGKSAICEPDPNSCLFSATYALSAVVESVEPLVHSGNTSITIRGSRFGTSIDDISLDIGNSPCKLSHVESDIIICYLRSAVAGDNHVRVRVGNKGMFSLNIIIIMNICNIYVQGIIWKKMHICIVV